MVQGYVLRGLQGCWLGWTVWEGSGTLGWLSLFDTLVGLFDTLWRFANLTLGFGVFI